ncbi:putative protein OS=Streptomyces rimosus subsp. rimosus (strain ATCC / DSM 40260 / JCM 4667 / NRRL 2234) OX=1265868 GN=SRIM_028980 PE=4 SV=1 [Streptomyces rimosus subsp. rimosus]
MHDVRALLTPAAFGGVVATVIDNNPGMDEATATRIVAEALKFVDAAATFPTVKITPSRVVDEGWHALILHTAPYATVCERLGRFVHHYPERPDPGRHDPHALTRTAALIEQAGHSVDGELWTGPAKASSGCGELLAHPEAGRLRPHQPRWLRLTWRSGQLGCRPRQRR